MQGNKNRKKKNTIVQYRVVHVFANKLKNPEPAPDAILPIIS